MTNDYWVVSQFENRCADNIPLLAEEGWTRHQ